jgi:aspartate/tyrosine/aromatic aminotransferase
MMFERAPLNPPDAIFGLIDAFKKDTNPSKINLSVGVYQNESGVTPVMDAVHQAEKKLLADRGTKSYLPIDGSPRYCEAVGRLILGDELFGGDAVHACVAQTPGGTVSLRLAAELLRRVFDVKSIWVSDPTWANHTKIFGMAGLEIKKYDYLDDAGTGIGFDGILASLASAQPGEAILLHAVCHNPTGVDPTPEQWEQLFQVIGDKGLVAVFDFAYQGFGESLEADAAPIRKFVSAGNEVIVCNSFSKNFGLYGERVGGLTAVSNSAEISTAVLSQIKLMVRTMYSNPPLHGASIVDAVLSDPDLRSRWESELNEIRERIIQLRSDFVAEMSQRLPGRDFEYINRQRGMFSYSGLSREQVDRLRDEHSIYALGSGRINIAGINSANMQRLCDAIASTY